MGHKPNLEKKLEKEKKKVIEKQVFHILYCR